MIVREPRLLAGEGTHENLVARLDTGACWPHRGVGGGVALAQELDAKWLVGKWEGTARTPRADGRLEVTFKEDRAFGVCGQTSMEVVCSEGKWTVEGGVITVEYFQEQPRTPVTWTLKRDADTLQGSGIRRSDSMQYTVTLKRAR